MPTALVTGATSGIGAAFADRLAADGHDLVLVARGEQRLAESAARLRERYAIDVEVLSADLTQVDQCATVERRLADTARPVSVLVNSAGFSLRRSFVRNALEDEQRLLDIHVRAVLRLTHAVLAGMVERGEGAVINVSSVAGEVPLGTYGAAKAWMTAFTEAVAAQLAGSGVRIMVTVPGFVRTELYQRMGMSTDHFPAVAWVRTEQVVDTALRDLTRGVVVSVPTLRYRAVTAALRLAPQTVRRRIATRR
jgi:short-subunit dehydrogenase